MSLRSEIEKIIRNWEGEVAEGRFNMITQEILTAIEAEASEHLFEMSKHMWVGAHSQRTRGVEGFVQRLVAKE